MKVQELVDLLEPLSTIQDTKALAPEHQVLQFRPDGIYGRTAHAAIDLKYSLGLAPFAMDSSTLLDTISTLNASDELKLSLEETTFCWESGSAKGRIATKAPSEFVPLPVMSEKATPCSPALGRVLELGALSCHNTALATIGMHGMMIREIGNRLWCMSSDNVTIAMASVELPETGICPKPLTVSARSLIYGIRSAPRAGILPTMAAHKGDIAFGPDYIQYQDPVYRAVVNLIPSLAKDVWSTAEPFMTNKYAIRLDKDHIKAFTRRTSLLTEAKMRWTITIAVGGGKVTLRFAENLASAEEHYTIADVGDVPPCEVTVDGYRLGNAVGLSRALQNADTLVLDHAARKLLIFRSTDGTFQYLVSGRAL
jgi:hypothetical protein